MAWQVYWMISIRQWCACMHTYFCVLFSEWLIISCWLARLSATQRKVWCRPANRSILQDLAEHIRVSIQGIVMLLPCCGNTPNWNGFSKPHWLWCIPRTYRLIIYQTWILVLMLLLCRLWSKASKHPAHLCSDFRLASCTHSSDRKCIGRNCSIIHLFLLGKGLYWSMGCVNYDTLDNSIYWTLCRSC